MVSIGRVILISPVAAFLGISLLTSTGCSNYPADTAGGGGLGGGGTSGIGGGGGTPTPTPTANPSATPALASLKGSYAFHLWGAPPAGNGTFFGMVGSFTADGQGNITGGLEDVYVVNGTDSLNPQQNLAITGGSYTMNGTGIGQVTLTAANPTYSAVLGIVLLSPSVALLSRLDSSASASGTAYLQNTADFSISAFASSSYVFNGLGVDAPNATTVAHAGVFTTDGNGNIASGVEDYNDGGLTTTDQSLVAASFTITTNGRMAGSISNVAAPFAAIFYIVDNTHLVFLESQGSQLVAVGEVYSQSVLSVSLPNSIAKGGYVFSLVTDLASPTFSLAGQAVFDGSAGNISSGVLDSNVGGTVNTNIPLTAGTGGTNNSHYQIDSLGRGTLQLSSSTLGNLTFNFYPSIHGLALIEMDTGRSASGNMFAQASGTFSSSSIDGDYAVSLFGINGTTGPFSAIGQLIANGSGAFSSGNLSVDNDGTPTSAVTGTSTYSSINASTGRGTIVLASSALPATINGVVYVIGPPTATIPGFVFMDTDTTQIAKGQAFTQGGF